MTDPRRSILDSPVFGVAVRGQRDVLSLSEVLARLARGDPLIFSGLRPHQVHAWHAFMVQSAALALHHAGTTKPWRDAAPWRDALLALSGGDADPWTPVVDDVAKPALLQPPVPEGTLYGFKSYGDVPDLLDSLIVTSINHVVKSARMGAARLDHWVYALIDLQTMQGFSGRSLYGIARMNSGFGNRPALGLAPALDNSTRFRRDVAVWLEQREAIADQLGDEPLHNAIALVWCQPWDGDSPLAVERLDPFFIEICRRIRLVSTGDHIEALGKPTNKSRIAGLALRGNVGDPWVPISVDDEPSALTTSGRGFHYSLLWQLWLGENWKAGTALAMRAADGDAPWLVAQALARGQGKTDGWHERRVRVTPRVGIMLRTPSGRHELAARAEAQMRRADDARRKVLRMAILVLQQGAPAKLDLTDKRADAWTARFDTVVDDVFFSHLWAHADAPSAEADEAWKQRLANLAHAVLESAMRSTPLPSARRFRIVTEAESTLRGACMKSLQCLPGISPNTPVGNQLPGDDDERTG